jgi:hypothetical protein
MLEKLLNLRSPETVLELEKLEKILQESLREIEPRSGYEGNLRRRLTDYSRTVPVIDTRPRARYTPTNNDVFLVMISVLSGAAVLIMGVRVAILTIAGIELLRNMKRNVVSRRWHSPRLV